MAINKVILVGNVGKDPEISYSALGDTIASFSLATTDRYKDKNSGESKDVTEWHRINCFRQTADVVKNYVFKGMQLYVEGRLRTREYTQDGIKRYVTEIVANTIQMLGKKEDNGQRQQAPAPQQRSSGRNAYEDAKNGRNMGYTQNPDMDDEIPF